MSREVAPQVFCSHRGKKFIVIFRTRLRCRITHCSVPPCLKCRTQRISCSPLESFRVCVISSWSFASLVFTGGSLILFLFQLCFWVSRRLFCIFLIPLSMIPMASHGSTTSWCFLLFCLYGCLCPPILNT